MTTMIAEWPGIDAIKEKIDSAKWFKFDKLPISNTPIGEVVKELGLIPFAMQQDVYNWESTISYWVNRINEYMQNPVELKDGFQLEDLAQVFDKGCVERLNKSDYDMWLPAYEYIKSKLGL